MRIEVEDQLFLKPMRENCVIDDQYCEETLAIELFNPLVPILRVFHPYIIKSPIRLLTNFHSG